MIACKALIDKSKALIDNLLLKALIDNLLSKVFIENP